MLLRFLFCARQVHVIWIFLIKWDMRYNVFPELGIMRFWYLIGVNILVLFVFFLRHSWGEKWKYFVSIRWGHYNLLTLLLHKMLILRLCRGTPYLSNTSVIRRTQNPSHSTNLTSLRLWSGYTDWYGCGVGADKEAGCCVEIYDVHENSD